MNLNDLRKKRNEILALAEKHGAGNVRVFGSVARGEAGPGSDVDFLIDIVDISRFTWGGGGLLVELEDLLKSDVDLVTEQDIHWLIRDQVVQEAVEL
ncbi:MAG: nucleotidyltransferase domain-containing protein [Chloroflexi bacterium]|nr:nucleotidyltransferase domain-containing protein [Chloroflexota bacterium]